MSEIDDGGMAFPAKFMIDNGYGFSEVIGTGMTLRDYFAGQALAGIMADPNLTFPNERLASWAYKLADAMLAARKVQS